MNSDTHSSIKRTIHIWTKKNINPPVKKVIQVLNRTVNKPNWYDLRNVTPVSKMFGKWRGQPVDRYYIEKFLSQHSHHIRGHLLEIAGDEYSSKFATGVERIDILHVNGKNPKATIIGDLTKPETLPKDAIDCFICTQTLQFIYDFKCAIQGIHYLLRNNGTVLATATGISKIARYDMQRWGEYWRFTTLSLYKAFSEVFGENNVNVDHYGNVLSAVAFLEGLASDELTKKELDFHDLDYEVLVTVVATKRI